MNSAAANPPLIELRNLYKRFGKNDAVVDLSLKVPQGAIYGLLGHNGAGKSTTIGMILGQVWPSSGSVYVNGIDVTRSRSKALQGVGAIFEAPAFYDYMSGWRNLEILGNYSGFVSPDDLRSVLAKTGLTGREHAKVRTYSHGMRARLALAQALLPRPKLLILDEPGQGLDPEGTHELRETILELNQQWGITILLSSHLLNEVEQICSGIAVMNRGRKVFDGPISQARAQSNWVRLKVDDFDRAVAFLRGKGLVAGSKEGRLILLPQGVGVDQVVQALVGHNHAVFEIAPEDESLESFYLRVIKDGRVGKDDFAPTTD